MSADALRARAPTLPDGAAGRRLLPRAQVWAREQGDAAVALDTVQWPGKVCRSIVLPKRLAGSTRTQG